jgi:hypothetical protein
MIGMFRMSSHNFSVTITRHEKRIKLVTYFSTFPAKFKKHLLCCKAYHTETYLRIDRIRQKLYPQRNIVTSVLSATVSSSLHFSDRLGNKWNLKT